MRIRLIKSGLKKSYRNGLVKVAVMVNGKHGQYSSHRWKSPTSAFSIMLEGLKKQGINTEQIDFVDKTTKEAKTQDEIIEEYKQSRTELTLQDFAKEKYAISKTSNTPVAESKEEKSEVLSDEDIKHILQNTDYEFYAVRGWDEELEAGEILEESYSWDYDYDRPTEETVGGTCTTMPELHASNFKESYETIEEQLQAIKDTIALSESLYLYRNIYLVGSNSRNPEDAYEADQNEAILADATVLGKVKKRV